MEALILTVHIIACFVLVTVVLLQSGKEGMGVIFGGGSSSLFGSTGAGGFLTKLTAWVGALFLITSLGFNFLTKSPRMEGSAMDGLMQQTAPAPEVEKPAVEFEEPAVEPSSSGESAPGITGALQAPAAEDAGTDQPAQ